MAPAVTGQGYSWATRQASKALRELVELVNGGPCADDDSLFALRAHKNDTRITCSSADLLAGVRDASIDGVIIDPPYEANVMYAELSDFFYVWLKRTAGLLFPEQFVNTLTDKDREAVANVAKFKDFSKVRGSGGAKKRATRDYQERMQAIFAECRRVLKPDGIMVLMFTHKATGAWDALAKGLVEAGFVISASWPINTEAEGSLHIKDKNAAKSTIFLVCRPRPVAVENAAPSYWEEIEPLVGQVVRDRVETFQSSGIRGVDLYLACFGPALEVFSRHWPMQRGRPAQKPDAAKTAKLRLAEDEDWDPYAVRPEDALMAARAAVKDWRLSQIASVKRHAHLDAVTEFFVLAWDAFGSPEFPADEALKLARVVGVPFDALRGRILELKSNDVVLWDSVTRTQKGGLGASSKASLLDVLHLAARAAREQNVGVAKEVVERAEYLSDPAFERALGAVLQVLPAPRAVTNTKVALLAGAAADAEALERLRRLAFADNVAAQGEWAHMLEAESRA
jgi:putative DNA methylase